MASGPHGRRGRITATRPETLLPLVAALILSSLVACDGAPVERERPPAAPLVDFDTTAAAVVAGGDTIPITVELANDGDRRAYGLMERDSLPPDHGMLFVYPEEHPGDSPFWMYRTRIPLDIAFVDAGGEIVAILGMEPCRSPNPDVCRRYAPGVAYRGALEMRRGWFADRGVDVGDTVLPAVSGLPSSP